MVTVNGQPLTGTFKERLYAARRAMGWSQSDLAREIWGTVTTKDGYEVAAKRDRISSYEKGRSIPEQDNLLQLAAIFDLDPADLAPDIMTARAERGLTTPPAVQLTMLQDEPGRCHLRIDTVVDFAVATQVLALISGNDHVASAN